MNLHIQMLPIDDREIDEIIWEEIKNSPSQGDFICYLLHAPVDAKYKESANKRIKDIDESRDKRPELYPKAIEKIRNLAETGNATALFHMGKIHALGIAIQQNLDLAVKWYKKAIAAGEPRAFSNLGWFYQSGYGVEKDLKKAFELLSSGAEGGVLSARAAVGMMLLAGEGCQAQIEKGLEMLEQAFDKGYVNAGNHLADIYLSGRYVSRDIEKGHEWLFKVVEKGDERTMAILGHYLVTGTHGKIDRKKGLFFLESAIELDFMPAYLWLAALYKNGTGVEKNPEMARQWYEKGIAAGSRECAEALKQLQKGENNTVFSTMH